MAVTGTASTDGRAGRGDVHVGRHARGNPVRRGVERDHDAVVDDARGALGGARDVDRVHRAVDGGVQRRDRDLGRLADLHRRKVALGDRGGHLHVRSPHEDGDARRRVTGLDRDRRDHAVDRRGEGGQLERPLRVADRLLGLGDGRPVRGDGGVRVDVDRPVVAELGRLHGKLGRRRPGRTPACSRPRPGAWPSRARAGPA